MSKIIQNSPEALQKYLSYIPIPGPGDSPENPSISQDPTVSPLQAPLGYTANPDSPFEDLSLVISNLISFITLIAAIAFIFYFILGTIKWITSGGDPQKVQAARTAITNALIGIFITAITYPVIYLLGQLFNIPFTSPADLITNLFT